MKEIGKLLELLNEYEKEVKKSEFYEWEKGIGGDTNLFRRDTRDEEGSHLYSDTADTYVISKKYGFIGWLVENDKIERPEIRSQGYTKPTYGYTTEPYTTCKSIELANTILMILAIKDEPINFLISILK